MVQSRFLESENANNTTAQGVEIIVSADQIEFVKIAASETKFIATDSLKMDSSLGKTRSIDREWREWGGGHTL